VNETEPVFYRFGRRTVNILVDPWICAEFIDTNRIGWLQFTQQEAVGKKFRKRYSG
jgi:hypothetical protein